MRPTATDAQQWRGRSIHAVIAIGAVVEQLGGQRKALHCFSTYFCLWNFQPILAPQTPEIKMFSHFHFHFTRKHFQHRAKLRV